MHIHKEPIQLTCIVCAISEACIRCSMTIVAFRFVVVNGFSSWCFCCSEKALFQRWFLNSFRPLSMTSVAMTLFTTSCRNLLISDCVAQRASRSCWNCGLRRMPQARSTDRCSAIDFPLYLTASSLFSFESWPLGTPGWSTSWI